MERNSSDKNDFAARIKFVMAHYNIVQFAFAKRTKIPSSSLNRYLNSGSKPGLDHIAKLVAAFPEIVLTPLFLSSAKASGL